MNTLLQIIPKAGQVCGVADYSNTLAGKLDDLYGLKSTFAAQSIEDDKGVPEKERNNLTSINAVFESWNSLRSSPELLLLHYVGYGYSKRGCPLWLLGCLKKWQRENPNARLVTMFHELYAFGKPWQSSFWTSPLQRWVCRELARISDGIVTSREESAEILRRMTRRDDVFNLPVFSSMGEPHVIDPLVEREPLMVIFGGKEWRTTAFLRDRLEIEAACHKWGIKEVVEIGAGQTPEVDLGIPVRRLGRLSAAEVSIWMRSCRLGFVSYLSSYLEKSSIFAAYAAHGVVPVLPQRALMPQTLGVIENRQYVCATNGEESMDFLEDRSRDVFAWYEGHRSSEHAKTFAKLLRQNL